MSTTGVENKDFPVVKRGYDPAAVDEHLRSLARQITKLQETSKQPTAASVAATAGTQVKAIIEAAEEAAAELKRDAEQEARRVRQEISEDARRVREDSAKEIERVRSEAEQEASRYIEQVSQASADLLERIDQLDGEIASLFENLRSGATRLAKELNQLKATPLDLQSAFEQEEGVDAGSSENAAESLPAIEKGGQLQVGDRPESVEPVDLEGARLVALEMALDGKPQSETGRYLADRFALPEEDIRALMSEVYANLGSG